MPAIGQHRGAVKTLRLIPGLSLALLAILASVPARSAEPSAAPTPDLAGSMLRQLMGFSTAYWARVAGRDTDLPARVNGHDEFAAAWQSRALDALHGLQAGVWRQQFVTPGFHFHPATRPGTNVVVVVPGSVEPQKAVVIAAHYDGEPFSRGSAYDDTSGSIVLLGLAEAMGNRWRTQGRPAITVEFALFDAEEQGLVGSTAYVSSLDSGALMPRPVLMIDEEQSGVGYPIRPFGRPSEPPVPSYAITGDRSPGGLTRVLGRVHPPAASSVRTLTDRLRAARHAVFADLRGRFPSLRYGRSALPAFQPADERYLQIGPSTVCCSDDAPFESSGIPTATFSGDFDFYRHPADQPWSFPFDQPQDTLRSLACATGGSPQPGPALGGALDLPMQLSAALLAQYAPPSAGSGFAAFSSVATGGKELTFSEFGVRNAVWTFGDGSRQAGSRVRHRFRRPGAYTISARAGTTKASYRLVVHEQAPPSTASMKPISPPPLTRWAPAPLRTVAGCH